MEIEIERTDLIISIQSSLVYLIGVMVFQVETDSDLRVTPYWNDDLEKDFEENLFEKFNIYIDLSKIDIMTIDNIADAVYKTVVVRETTVDNGSREPDEIPKSGVGQNAETLDLETLLLVLNEK
jgi:hypothetical protein